MKPHNRRHFMAGISAAAVATSTSSVLAAPLGKTKAPARKSLSVRPTHRARISSTLQRKVVGHKMRPAHVRGIQSDVGLPVRQHKITRLPPGWTGKTGKTPQLDLAAFGESLFGQLKPRLAGYAMQIRRKGKPVHATLWKRSRGPKDGNKLWDFDTRMHIASISKLMTAMAMVRCLDLCNRGLDERIEPWLPHYWNRGPSVDTITFRQLLRHRSGFVTEGSDSDYQFMRAQVAKGVAGTVGDYNYRNMNFGLCRILIPALLGSVDLTETYGPLTDPIWDVLTVTRFKHFCNAKIFAPAGVSKVGFHSDGKGALAYPFPLSNASAWDSGNLISMAGGAGFRMSINEVARVMDTFRRSGKIFSSSRATAILNNGLGIDQIVDTPAGRLYSKNGRWRDNGREERCVAFFLPQDMELVIFVNSKILTNKLLRTIVTDTYLDNLV